MNSVIAVGEPIVTAPCGVPFHQDIGFRGKSPDAAGSSSLGALPDDDEAQEADDEFDDDDFDDEFDDDFDESSDTDDDFDDDLDDEADGEADGEADTASILRHPG